MERALEKLELDCRLESASGGQEAFDLVAAEHFDLVITDIRMPGGGGVELTERMRRRGIDATVLWITAYGCETYREDAERLDVFRCVEKPLEVNMIRAVVKNALQEGRRAARSEE
jgi:two-component system response regulator PilR (NtrC family)